MTSENKLENSPHLRARAARLLRILFTIRSRGFGVPIAVSLLLAAAPIVLLFQQNRLISIQGEISESDSNRTRNAKLLI